MYGASLKIWNIKDDLPTPCSLFSNRACCLFHIRCSVCAHYKKKNSARKGMFPLKIPLLCGNRGGGGGRQLYIIHFLLILLLVALLNYLDENGRSHLTGQCIVNLVFLVLKHTHELQKHFDF